MTQEEMLKEFSKYWVNTEGKNELKAFAIKSVEEVRKYVKKRYGNEIPDAEDILFDYFNMCRRPDDSMVSISDFFCLNTIREVARRPDAIFEIYEKVKNSKNFWIKDDSDASYRYSADPNKNMERFAYFTFHEVFNTARLKIGKEELFNLSRERKIAITDAIRSYFKEDYKKRFSNLKANYVRGIITSIQILQNLGQLETLVEKNNYIRNLMGLDVLTFDLKAEKSSGKYSLEDLLNEEVLDSLPLEKLALMNSFYSNRAKKIADFFGMGFFICSKLDDFNISSEKPDGDKVLQAYSQYKFLDKAMKAAWPQIRNNIQDYTEDEVNSNKQVGVYTPKIYDDFIAKFEKAYALYNEHEWSLSDDFNCYCSTSVMIDYDQKDCSMETLLLIAMESFQTTNWGYIPEENHGKNSIENNKENILLGFDIPGFNMPVRLHIQLEKLRAFFGSIDKSYEIPNYIGNDDMEVWDKNMGAAILMPLSPQHRKYLISSVKKMKTDNPHYKFARHIECMQYDNNLFRMQKLKDPNGRKGARTYTNILTGEVIKPTVQRG